MYDFSNLEKQFSEWNMVLNEQQKVLLSRYYEMLIEKNKVMNLTTITSWGEVCTKHYLDSAALLHALPSSLDGKKLIDIGTGAGFPGLVLKILLPTVDVTLLDALMKRVRFLSEVIVQLQLNPSQDEVKNVSRETSLSAKPLEGGCRAIHGRAEELAFVKKDISKSKNAEAVQQVRGQYDFVTARAVSDLRILSEYAVPLLKTDGYFFAYKSADADSEIRQAERAIDLLGGKIVNVLKYRLPLTDIGRSLVIIQKTKNTPNQYPRQSTLIKKKPL